jgi:hypothetical protein
LYPAAFCSTRNGIPSCFSSLEWFGTEFRQFVSIFVPRNGISSCFLFCGRVWNPIQRVFFYFCSTERNSELFSLPRKGSERNSERFLFRGTAGNHHLFRLFRLPWNYFLSEIPNPITVAFLFRVFGGFLHALHRFTASPAP